LGRDELFCRFQQIVDDDVIINEELDDYLELPAYDTCNEHFMRKSQADILYFLTKMTRHADLKNKLKILSVFVALDRFIRTVDNGRRTEFKQWYERFGHMTKAETW
jgi:hypothetical protein